ncbi:MAG: hypothetical protein R6W84_08265 [Promethearchaeia archaeon]
MRSENIIKKIYLIFPIISLILWGFLADFTGIDFTAYYNAGKYIFTMPELIYSDLFHPKFLYCPGIAVFSFFFTLCNIGTAMIIYFFISLLFGILSIITLDQILSFKNISKRLKLVILMIVSNGFAVEGTFANLQSKFIVLFLILILIKREIEKVNYNIKFLSVQTFILVLAISFLPYLIFLGIIYIFYKSKDYFLHKSLLLGVEFLIFNFLFIIKPSTIMGFLDGFETYSYLTYLYRSGFPSLILSYLREIIVFPKIIILQIITVVSLSMGSLYLMLKDYSLEEKFGIIFLVFLLFSSTYYPSGHIVAIFPIIFLLFKKETCINYIFIFILFLLYCFPLIETSRFFDLTFVFDNIKPVSTVISIIEHTLYAMLLISKIKKLNKNYKNTLF